MATFQDGNVRRATANTVTAMKRSAARRQCKACGRKSAMVRTDDGRFCRWCGAGALTYDATNEQTETPDDRALLPKST